MQKIKSNHIHKGVTRQIKQEKKKKKNKPKNKPAKANPLKLTKIVVNSSSASLTNYVHYILIWIPEIYNSEETAPYLTRSPTTLQGKDRKEKKRELRRIESTANQRLTA